VPDERTGDEIVELMGALAHPHRLRILALLHEGRSYVSQLARDVRLSRPLVHMHLQRLEAAGLVRGTMEVSDDGKAMKYFDLVPFSIRLTPSSVARAAESLTLKEEQ
jgi:DNA-binding transcriptional ArsR family regulator